MGSRRSTFARSKGGKYDKLADQLMDNVESEFREDAGSGTTLTTTGEIRVDVSGQLDDLTFSQVCNQGNAHTAEWTPRTTDSIFEHGTPSGAFTLGETVTGGTSGSTAVVEGVGADFIQVSTISAPFEVGEVITGGTSTETATLTHPTIAAGGDPEISQQRFAVYTFRDNTLAVLGAPTGVAYTALIRGTAPPS
jgi:hypothetical protein